MRRIVEEENLDHPKDSVEFLEHVKNHEKKTRHHKHRLHKCSKILLIVGVVMLGYMGLRHMVHKRNMHRIERDQNEEEHFGGRRHRLGASAQVEDTSYGQTFSAISVAVWGLVIAKAKSGIEAAQKNDVESVGAAVKKITVFTALIAGASLLQMMGAANTANPVEAVQTVASTQHKLKAEHHPASYYDESSSHYKGGAHNVLIDLVKSGNVQAPKPD